MGTGILATLVALLGGPGVAASGPAAAPATPAAGTAGVAATILGLAAWSLFLGLATAFAVRCARSRTAWDSAVHDVGQRPFLGTVSMGVLSVGSATATVVPMWVPALGGAARGVDLALFVAGTALGLAVTLDAAARLLRGGRAGLAESATPVFGLAVVPPMVSATAGAAFLDELHAGPARAIALAFLGACFALSLGLGAVAFGAAYRRQFGGHPVPLPQAASFFIPLGVVGQSTAAAQLLGDGLAGLVPPGAAGVVRELAEVYGFVVLGVLGLLGGLYAVALAARGLVRRMPFSPGWWAMTFPVGTCALGAYWLGRLHDVAGWGVLAAAITALLAGTWALCSCATVAAVVRRR